MMLESLMDVLLLFGLGFLGWLLFSRFHFPAPAFFGTIFTVGAIRILGYPLPLSPPSLSLLVQILLGMYVGSKVTRSTVKEFKTMIIPAVIIVTWALSIVFLLGYFLSRVTYLDPITAILASSIGGLPEMTVIALAVGADLAVIIIMQTFRIIATIFTFPLILNLWMKRENNKYPSSELAGPVSAEPESGHISNELPGRAWLKQWGVVKDHLIREKIAVVFTTTTKVFFSLAVAAVGGSLLMALGVPAGGMVGSMFFVAVAALLGAPVVTPSEKITGFLLVGVGLMVSDNLSYDTITVLMTGSIFTPVIVSTIIIFISSILVAYLIYRLTNWDFPTCFLAAAPGGFTIMTALAIRYNKDPFRVSMLHLCRLLAIKSIVPFVFMIYF